MSALFDRVKASVATVVGAGEEDITRDSGPDTLAGWDSVSHLNLVLALEQEFCITFTDDEVTDMISVGLICGIIEERVGDGRLQTPG